MSNINQSKDGPGVQTQDLSIGRTPLQAFFFDALKDIYWSERHLVSALPTMKKAATTEQLQAALDDHIRQTREHVARLEHVFELLVENPEDQKCDGMEAIVIEGQKVVNETEEGSMTRDAGLIVAAQKIEHYEIAIYGSLLHMSRTMGRDDIARILGQTLDEEKLCDKLLTEIAESEINWEAEQEGSVGYRGRAL
jgi:ferritin-like metal-binding protein YciE